MELLDQICTVCQGLGDKLCGVYLHGSLTFGCFCWEQSDVDFLVVVKEPLTLAEKKTFMERLLALEPLCPPKGMEMSIVLDRYCRKFIYPTPYELHYSNTHRQRAMADLEEYCRSMNGTDKDLAAHFTVIRTVGQVLWGESINNLFVAVPSENYWDSLLYDIDHAVEDIVENPVYIILNLCRVLAYKWDQKILSKKGGGLWGLERLPERWHSLICAALKAYAGEAYLSNGEEILFAKFMLKEIMQPQKEETV